MSRNGGRDPYRAVAAEARADGDRGRPKASVLVAQPDLAAHVESRLRAKDSPMTISIELARGVYPDVAGTVSHEAIYRAVNGHGRRGLPAGLHTGLHPAQALPQTPSPSRPGAGQGWAAWIVQPDRASTTPRRWCEIVGHLEGDLICGSFNRSAIVTLFDRASRYCWLADLPEGHSAPATLAALVEALDQIPEELRRTLTWDQGSEMAEHATLAEMTGIDVFFAEPHSPWQRPTNENGNGLLRRYVGKGTDLGVYTPADLRAIETRLNTMPRRSLRSAP